MAACRPALSQRQDSVGGAPPSRPRPKHPGKKRDTCPSSTRVSSRSSGRTFSLTRTGCSVSDWWNTASREPCRGSRFPFGSACISCKRCAVNVTRSFGSAQDCFAHATALESCIHLSPSFSRLSDRYCEAEESHALPSGRSPKSPKRAAACEELDIFSGRARGRSVL